MDRFIIQFTGDFLFDFAASAGVFFLAVIIIERILL